MEKFIPYEKLSKKEKRKMDLAKRQTWGELNPVTRKPENSKAYNRNKARNWKREYHEHPVPGLFIYIPDSLLREADPCDIITLYIRQYPPRHLHSLLRAKQERETSYGKEKS